MTTLNIGLTDQQRKDIAEALSRLLADAYVLYLKTQNFHWNITGRDFYSLHLLLEKQYEELADAVDVYAERIRALGHTAPGSFAQFLQLTSLKEETQMLKADDMLRQLLSDHEACARNIRKTRDNAHDDAGTIHILEEHLSNHEKTAWMLRSLLQ